MTATLNDVRLWAETHDDDRDALYELMKVPARLGLHDDDLGLLPADLAHFEVAVAPSGYGIVSKAADLDGARRRANGRVRALLKRFHAATTPRGGASEAVRADWNALIDYVAEREGFVARGAAFPTGASRALTALRARAQVPPAGLDQAEIDRIGRETSTEKRRSVARAVARLNDLVAARAAHPDLIGFLPSGPLVPPRSGGRPDAIVWSELPAAFQADCARIFVLATETPADQARRLRARIAAGEDEAQVMAEFEGLRTRTLGNRKAAHETYRQAVAFLLRTARDRGFALSALSDLTSVLTVANVEAAIEDHVARHAANPLALKDPKTSQTLKGRLGALITLARHGLRDASLAANLELLGAERSDVVKSSKALGMPAETRLFLRELIGAPHLAARLVNAPARIAAKAEQDLAAAAAERERASATADRDAAALLTARSERRELSALRLYASAVFFAIQMSRPVRSGNLIKARVGAADASARGALHRLVWMVPEKKAQIRFAASEVKTAVPVTVTIVGEDARILWRWTSELRARYVELRQLAPSPYLVPGQANPRLLKDGVDLPRGCVSPSTFAEIWKEGEAIVGVPLHPHACRHAIATLILAVRPGSFALAASVLAISEATVKLHYGHEDGERAAAVVRQTLLAEHPDLFKTMEKKLK